MIYVKEAVDARHSVRQYDTRPLEEDVKQQLLKKIDSVNKESGLHIQLVCDEPKAFDGFMAHYGKFSGVRNYLAIVGPKAPDFEQKCGYYGEKLVLFAQMIGLNTCWVALTYSKVKKAFVVDKGEKLALVIAIGYGLTQGHEHKSKLAVEIAPDYPTAPKWFKDGIDCVLKAPSAINQQKFRFTLDGNRVLMSSAIGPCAKIDLGIAKYHFEIGSGMRFQQ